MFCKLKDGIKLDSTPLINLDVKYLRGTSAGKAINSGKFVTANSYMILVDGENSGEVFRTVLRSEERRVGKECRSRWSPYH